MAATDTKRPKAASASPPARKPGTKDAWAKKAVHLVTCPSGMDVTIRIPNLPTLIKGGVLPNTLRNAALREYFDPIASRAVRAQAEHPGELGVSMEEFTELLDLHEWLILHTVLEPALTADDLQLMPPEDIQFLSEIVNRERTTDAAGRSLGTESLSRWETFRRFHGCPPDCEACQKVIDEVSTSDG